MEHAAFDQGLAHPWPSTWMPLLHITDLRAESLYMTVKQEMDQPKKKEPGRGS